MRTTRTLRQVGRGRLRHAQVVLAGLALALVFAVASCGQKEKPSEPRVPREVEVPLYLKDTVGELARFAGRESLAVQGYGFVTGLDGTGTKVIPPGVRQQILDMMRRHKIENPEEVISSPDNAVVLVTGLLTPGIARGEVFDIEVRALPTTETTSLEGGYLLECDLARVMSARGVEERSEILAIGRGSIFVSPFTAEDKSKLTSDPRVGRVLAGGKCAKMRHFRLALLTPSVRTADQIVRLINARFKGAAKGTEDPGRVDLEVPPEFEEEKEHFLDLIGALYLRETPDARDQRVNLLIDRLKEGKDMDRVAVCLEAFGPMVVPHLRLLTKHPSAAVRFYVGRTLANLQDAQAVSLLEPVALDNKSEFQELAVESMGRLRSGVGLGVLSRALNAKSARVRVAAWQAMARLAPRTFISRVFPDKFSLSLVSTTGEPFVYVSRTLRPEVAIFGDVSIRPPALVETRRVTATAAAGVEEITLITRWHDKDYCVKAPLEVKGFIQWLAAPMDLDKKPEPQGLDLGYSDVVGLLNELGRKKALTAPVVLQPLKFRIGGDRPVARPIGESEETIETAPLPPPPGTKKEP